jgi:hypothetical protein
MEEDRGGEKSSFFLEKSDDPLDDVINTSQDAFLGLHNIRAWAARQTHRRTQQQHTQTRGVTYQKRIHHARKEGKVSSHRREINVPS